MAHPLITAESADPGGNALTGGFGNGTIRLGNVSSLTGVAAPMRAVTRCYLTHVEWARCLPSGIARRSLCPRPILPSDLVPETVRTQPVPEKMIRDFLTGKISRRNLIGGLISAGLSITAAVAFADELESRPGTAKTRSPHDPQWAGTVAPPTDGGSAPTATRSKAPRSAHSPTPAPTPHSLLTNAPTPVPYPTPTTFPHPTPHPPVPHPTPHPPPVPVPVPIPPPPPTPTPTPVPTPTPTPPPSCASCGSCSPGDSCASCGGCSSCSSCSTCSTCSSCTSPHQEVQASCATCGSCAACSGCASCAPPVPAPVRRRGRPAWRNSR